MGLTKRGAVRLANSMAGLRPQIIKAFESKAGSFAVEYSDVVRAQGGVLVEVRRRFPEVPA